MAETVNILRKDLRDLLNQIDLLEHSLATRVKETGAVLLTEKHVAFARSIAEWITCAAGSERLIARGSSLEEYAKELLAALSPEK